MNTMLIQIELKNKLPEEKLISPEKKYKYQAA
jgi:hypothetical protein